MTMTEREYHKRPELNSSALARFYQGADYALTPVKPQPSWEFGHIFESFVQQQAEGSKVFDNRYFIAKGLKGTIPDKLLYAINTHADLSKLYVYTAKGERSKTQARLHSWVDAQVANRGKMPVSASDFERAKRMTDNLFKTPFRDGTIRDYLERAQWQVPFFWTSQGLKKRGLADILIAKDGEVELLADLKSTASPKDFRAAAKQRLWIQERHYTEGITANFGPVDYMLFFAVQNTEPWVAFEPIQFNYASHQDTDEAIFLMQQKYQSLCEAYHYWRVAGKQASGYIDIGAVNVWV